MPKILTTYGNVADGRLNLTERDKFTAALGGWRDGAVKLVVTYLYGKRSNPQNAYYWAVVVPLIREGMEESMGESITDEEVHEWLKQQFNPRPIRTTNGHTFTLPGDTKSLDTAEFAAYLERCRQFAADTLGIDIPDPVKLETACGALNA